MGKTFKTIDEAVIRFAGDSGDGMQLTGGRFTETTAIVGNDLSTLPDFPAEIRAPAGSLAGVSAFQIKFSSKDIHTPGVNPDVLVAMNPAALKVHQKEIIPGGTLIINTDAFTKKNLKFAGYESNPIEDGSLDDSMFGGNAMTYYGRWSYKFEEGLRQGAAGVIVVHETLPAGYPFAVLQGGYAGEQLTIEDPNRTPLSFQGWMPLETAEKLFEMNGLNFQQSKESAVNADFKAMTMDAKFTSKISNSVRRFSSNNIIAKYEGSDPILKDEYIIYTAHWDHMGINKKLDGDKIYNGANDNALGTGLVMAAAEAFTNLKNGSKRSILFLAVTAEEQGLLGARYYGINPLYPLEKTVAVINIDAMGNTFGRTKDLIVVGKGNSELDYILEMAAAQDGKYLIPDAEPEKGFYYRSDHFEFAKQGVPALYADGGIDVVGKGTEYGYKKKDEYTYENYHALSDEVKDDWDYSGMVEDGRILFRVGYAAGQHSKWPEWSDGTEFKSKRIEMLKNYKY